MATRKSSAKTVPRSPRRTVVSPVPTPVTPPPPPPAPPSRWSQTTGWVRRNWWVIPTVVLTTLTLWVLVANWKPIVTGVASVFTPTPASAKADYVRTPVDNLPPSGVVRTNHSVVRVVGDSEETVTLSSEDGQLAAVGGGVKNSSNVVVTVIQVKEYHEAARITLPPPPPTPPSEVPSAPTTMVWPRDFTPSRTIIITPSLCKEVGEIDELVESIGIGEDVRFVLPGGWNVKSFTPRNIDPASFDLSLDDKHLEVKDGDKLTVGKVLRYRNRSEKTMKVGFRCTRPEEGMGL